MMRPGSTGTSPSCVGAGSPGNFRSALPRSSVASFLPELSSSTALRVDAGSVRGSSLRFASRQKNTGERRSAGLAPRPPSPIRGGRNDHLYRYHHR
ncbi:hypothetical protein ACFFX0_31735 [Citricoccus parietis]|uniref:Uncharacterized protein n=1 Tax=Citricoccus parietis TaxID=592307 RepID=A0ABV5G974_9MICC